MPGLSVARSDEAGDHESFQRALEDTRFFDRYEVELAQQTDGVQIGETTYEGYPLRRLETEHATAYLEGCLYDVDDVESHVKRVASMVAEDAIDELREWVRRRDGDFLLAFCDGDEVALVNDALGRLPTYYATVDGTVVCSRELKFVREFARQRGRPLELDRLGVGQFCCFGYPLGDRTTFEGVRTVPPGSLVRLDGDVDVTSIAEFDFGRCRHAERSVEENARGLADRIETACEDRSFPNRTTVLSLSGGVDSRILAAAYSATDEPVQAATFHGRGDGSSDDVASAAAVADALGLDWRTYGVEGTEAHDSTLLDAKQGLNYLGMGHILDFFEQLRDRYRSPVYSTGLAGDKLLVDLTPSKRLESTSDLVDYVVGANSRLSLSESARVAGVDEARLRESVARRVRSYPESDLADRYVHFLLRERGINFVVHGDDRNRYYVWSVAPFFSLPVFQYAMDCPPEQKRYRRLHAAIFELYEPALVDVHYPNFGAPISSNRYRAKQFVYDFLERYPELRGRVVGLLASDDEAATDVRDSIRAQLPDLEDAPLSRRAVVDVAHDGDSHSATELSVLHTMTSLALDVGTDEGGGREHALAEGRTERGRDG